MVLSDDFLAPFKPPRAADAVELEWQAVIVINHLINYKGVLNMIFAL